jgi:hypothetical protein
LLLTKLTKLSKLLLAGARGDKLEVIVEKVKKITGFLQQKASFYFSLIRLSWTPNYSVLVAVALVLKLMRAISCRQLAFLNFCPPLLIFVKMVAQNCRAIYKTMQSLIRGELFSK